MEFLYYKKNHVILYFVCYTYVPDLIFAQLMLTPFTQRALSDLDVGNLTFEAERNESDSDFLDLKCNSCDDITLVLY